MGVVNLVQEEHVPTNHFYVAKLDASAFHCGIRMWAEDSSFCNIHPFDRWIDRRKDGLTARG